jgi:hypothetical protein
MISLKMIVCRIVAEHGEATWNGTVLVSAVVIIPHMIIAVEFLLMRIAQMFVLWMQWEYAVW